MNYSHRNGETEEPREQGHYWVKCGQARIEIHIRYKFPDEYKFPEDEDWYWVPCDLANEGKDCRYWGPIPQPED